MRVLAAMSGGVDSSVAAARAVEAGHDVIGVHMALQAKPGTLRTGSRGCCTVEDAHDARRAADTLEVPFYVWDFAERFSQDVVSDFLAEYEAGRTPNPCVRCNEKIKFAALLDKGIALGFDAVCTGHYARLSVAGGTPRLRRAVDEGKDQSYVLASLTPQQLRQAMFPLGDTAKTEVRAEAERRGLLVADKPDSHDICFIPDGDTRGFVGARVETTPGDLVDDATGEVLGTHSGVHGFTIGQRKGLGIDAPAADGRPRYVLSLEPAAGQVRVGSRERLAVTEIRTEAPGYPSGTPLTAPVDCAIQVRAHGGVAAASLSADAGALTARLAEPIYGVAPGQTLVAYCGDEVRAAARIASTA